MKVILMIFYNYINQKGFSGTGAYNTLYEAMKDAFRDNELKLASCCEIIDGDKSYDKREMEEYWDNHLFTDEKDLNKIKKKLNTINDYLNLDKNKR
jgi:hypothetical protein